MYAVGSIAGKLATKHHIANPWLYNFMWAVLATLCLLPLALINHVGLPQDWASMTILALANAISGTAFIMAFYAVDVSVMAPLSNLRTPIMVLVGVMWFREFLSPFQWLLIGVIFLGGMAVNAEEKFHIRSFVNRKTALVLLFVITSAWFNSYTKYTLQFNGYWEVLLWQNILGILFLLPTLPLFYKDLTRTKPYQYSGLLISTILFLGGYMFEVMALKENISITMTIIALPLSMLLAIAFSVFAPKLLEKHTTKVYAIRLTAAAVMVAAALVLSK